MDADRYRAAELALWRASGGTPTERRIHLDRNDVEVRVQEFGEGPPVLFLHGGPGAGGSWAPLAARLADLRCLVVDRPGTGLSAPQVLPDVAAVRRQAETFAVDVLDALALDSAHLVGSSHGGWMALLAAARFPDRVQRTVQLGCPGVVEGMSLTALDRTLLLPGVGRVFAALPANERAVRSNIRQLGHSASLEAGRIPQELVDWALALQRHTDTMGRELGTMAKMGTFRGGFDPLVTVDRELLADVRSPTYLLWGTEDVYGGEDIARFVADALPSAKLELMPQAGHLCWIDDPDHAATVVRRHLLA